jgi:putative ABC transport system permease protein
MNIGWVPVRTAASSELRRRRLQTLIIAFVIMLASGAATLALSLLVETDAPYDHAFAHANGAHLVVAFDGRRVDAAHLRSTASAPGVIASAGPWPMVETVVSTGNQANQVNLAGRPSPDAAVDHLTMESGRWAQSPGEIVLSQRIANSLGVSTGEQVTVGQGKNPPALTVVGIAASISPFTDAWVQPAEIAKLVSSGSPPEYEMLYRVQPAGTITDLRRATQAIAARVPHGSVLTASNYLDVKRNADLTTAVMTPFLLAFSAFALLAAIFVIANVVSGVVIAGYRDLGIMKSIGFTPGQVMLVLLGQILAPVIAGCAIGIAIGTVASQPFLRQTAEALGLPSPFTAAIPVDLLVLAGVVAAAILAAMVPAWRAGRMSAVTAITTGSAPSAQRAGGVTRFVSALPLPRAMSLGIGDAVARPVRSATTLGAILIGVATVIFALSLHLSLQQVAVHLIRDNYVQVQIDRPSGAGLGVGKRGAPPGPITVPSDRQVTNAIRSDPNTARFVAEANRQVTVPGIAEPITYYAYRGSSNWIGFALISGRWFSHPGEVVAPTRLITQSHLHVGQYFTARFGAASVRLHLVGEILDQTDDDLLLRGSWASLAAVTPHLQATDYEIQVKPGTDPVAYRNGFPLQTVNGVPAALNVDTVERSSANTTFILLNTVVAGLALVLIAIAVAGVFNTVVLSTREKVRDVAILKAVGMAPAQVVAMVITGVAFLGLIAGVVGIPLGYMLHREIIQFMGQVASNTAIPPAFFDLIPHTILPLLGLAGVAIAAIGAWIPAQWAAARRVAGVLQTE